MSYRARLFASLFLAGGALAGCVDAVHPFQPEMKPLPPEFAEARAAPSVIVVTPVKGLPDPLSHELAKAMAEALEKRSLPVDVGEDTESRALYSVSGRFEAQKLGNGANGPGVIAWEVRDERGQLVGRHPQLVPPGGDPASPVMRTKLVAETAGEPAAMMAKGIEGDLPVPLEPAAGAAARTAAPSARSHSLVVASIEGAPANGGATTLRQAIEYALKVAKVKVVERETADSLLLDGTVATSDVKGGTKHVKVTWSIMRQDGTVLGEVSQENNVPTHLLERVWGEIASAVAQNAAGGIAALVDEADRPKVE